MYEIGAGLPGKSLDSLKTGSNVMSGFWLYLCMRWHSIEMIDGWTVGPCFLFVGKQFAYELSLWLSMICPSSRRTVNKSTCSNNEYPPSRTMIQSGFSGILPLVQWPALLPWLLLRSESPKTGIYMYFEVLVFVFRRSVHKGIGWKAVAYACRWVYLHSIFHQPGKWLWGCRPGCSRPNTSKWPGHGRWSVLVTGRSATQFHLAAERRDLDKWWLRL